MKTSENHKKRSWNSIITSQQWRLLIVWWGCFLCLGLLTAIINRQYAKQCEEGLQKETLVLIEAGLEEQSAESIIDIFAQFSVVNRNLVTVHIMFSYMFLSVVYAAVFANRRFSLEALEVDATKDG